jgi:glycine oxidase
MTKKMDAIIVGGGIIGSSIAYHMAARGMKVVLLERDRLASQASSAAAGMLAAQAEFDEAGPLFDLALKSRAMYPSLAAELRELSGIDIGLENKGLLRIAITAEQVEELHKTLAFQRQAGQQAEWLSPEETKRREPGISTEIAGAMYVEQDGHVAPPELSHAFAKAAAVLGADIREFTEVKSLILEQGKISGVVTQGETFYSDRVVIATSNWSGPLLEQSGLNCPVYPVKGECFSVLTHAPLIRSTLFSHGCYLAPKKGGRLIVGATMKEHTYDRAVTIGGISELMDQAKYLLPGIVDAEWEKAWSGLRPQTLDGLPYLGEHSEWKGLYVSTGHYRNGILLSAISGKLAADWAEGKPTDGLSLEAFRVDRHRQESTQKAGVSG